MKKINQNDDMLDRFSVKARLNLNDLLRRKMEEKKIDKNIQQAINEGACVFYPFTLINSRTEHFSKILSNFESIVAEMWDAVDFNIDGIVIETTNEAIKKHMGSTRRSHRWQIAFKVNEESAEVEVVNIIPQTSRTGRISPVAELVPTKLSGATISRVTAHHYNMVKTNGVGPGAIVQLVRSGLVIPKIEKVIKNIEFEVLQKPPQISIIHPKGAQCVNSHGIFMTFGRPFFIEFRDPAKPLKTQQASCENLFSTFWCLLFWYRKSINC